MGSTKWGSNFYSLYVIGIILQNQLACFKAMKLGNSSAIGFIFKTPSLFTQQRG